MRIGFKSQIILVILAMMLSSALLIGGIAFIQGRNAIQERVYSQLVSLRNAKADRIESYFSTLLRQAVSMSESAQMKNALIDFEKAFSELQYINVSTPLDVKAEGSRSFNLSSSVEESLKEFYRKHFIPRLRANLTKDLTLETFFPKNKSALLLQYWYLLGHPGNSSYNELYFSWQSTLKSVAKAFEYTNLYLINSDGDLLYSLYPEVDLGTNLFTGIYKDSAFAKKLNSIKLSKAKSEADIVDFEVYHPHYGMPSAFIISPVFDKGVNIGFIAYRINTNRINYIMTYGKKWEDCGLGLTGETYLVGSDYLMRSDSRLFLENPSKFLAAQARVSNLTEIEAMKRQKTSILWQEVHTLPVERALKGKDGIMNAVNYKKGDSLSAYKFLTIPGLPWVLIAEISSSEAYSTSRDFILLLITVFVFLAVAGTIIANWISNYFSTWYGRT